MTLTFVVLIIWTRFLRIIPENSDFAMVLAKWSSYVQTFFETLEHFATVDTVDNFKASQHLKYTRARTLSLLYLNERNKRQKLNALCFVNGVFNENTVIRYECFSA